MERLDVEDFKELTGDWFTYLAPVIASEDMFNLYQELKKKAKFLKILPTSENVFRAFKLCPLKEFRLIIMGMEPYCGVYPNGKPQATGLALCNGNSSGKLQPSLIKFWEGVSKDVGQQLPQEKNLSFLAEQGVLLVNRSLTVSAGLIGSHEGTWDFFWKYFFENIINVYYPEVQTIFLGRSAQTLSDYTNNPYFFLEHPSRAARENREWKTDGVFTFSNRIIEKDYNKGWDIVWNSEEYSKLVF